MPESVATGPNGAFSIALKTCRRAWNQALAKSRKKGLGDSEAIQTAQKAYIRAPPLLYGRDEIRAYIACVEEGMTLGAIVKEAGTKLRHMAHIALHAIPREIRRAGRPRKKPQAQPPSFVISTDNNRPHHVIQKINTPSPQFRHRVTPDRNPAGPAPAPPTLPSVHISAENTNTARRYPENQHPLPKISPAN